MTMDNPDRKPIQTTRGLLLLAFLPISDLGDCKDWKEIPPVVAKCKHQCATELYSISRIEVRCDVCNYRYLRDK